MAFIPTTKVNSIFTLFIVYSTALCGSRSLGGWAIP